MNTHVVSRLCLTALLTLLCTLSASATPVVRILFYTGEVTVTSSGKARIGQVLNASDEVVIGHNATLQLSIDGKVLKYAQPMRLKVSDAIKRAGAGENLAVANTLRTIAGASGVDREGRSSVAGATRAEDSSTVIKNAKDDAEHKAETELSSEVERHTGIKDPSGILRDATAKLKGEDMLALEPRSTGVLHGPILFRWMRNYDAKTYRVTVKNYLGDVIFTTTTSDTSAVWENPSLTPEAIYSWTLDDPDNSLRTATASFHEVSEATGAELSQSQHAIEKELGKNNPALPMLLAGLYSDNGCYGLAARYYTQAAMDSQEHYEEFMRRAVDEYQYNMYLSAEELAKVYKQ